jgi:hypothetical protein
MKTVTQRLRKPFQVMWPVCGFTALPSLAEISVA